MRRGVVDPVHLKLILGTSVHRRHQIVFAVRRPQSRIPQLGIHVLLLLLGCGEMRAKGVLLLLMLSSTVTWCHLSPHLSSHLRLHLSQVVTALHCVYRWHASVDESPVFPPVRVRLSDLSESALRLLLRLRRRMWL